MSETVEMLTIVTTFVASYGRGTIVSRSMASSQIESFHLLFSSPLVPRQRAGYEGRHDPQHLIGLTRSELGILFFSSPLVNFWLEADLSQF